MAINQNPDWYAGKPLSLVINTAIPESPRKAFHGEQDYKKASDSLRSQVNTRNAVIARGGHKINMNSPDESLALSLKKKGKQLKPLDARVYHALTLGCRTYFDPEKVCVASNVIPTLQEADFVVSVESDIIGREGHPDTAFVKAYIDTTTENGIRWHVVYVDESLNFITQFSSPCSLSGRVMRVGIVIGVGKPSQPVKEKKSLSHHDVQERAIFEVFGVPRVDQLEKPLKAPAGHALGTSSIEQEFTANRGGIQPNSDKILASIDQIKKEMASMAACGKPIDESLRKISVLEEEWLLQAQKEEDLRKDAAHL